VSPRSIPLGAPQLIQQGSGPRRRARSPLERAHADHRRNTAPSAADPRQTRGRPRLTLFVWTLDRTPRIAPEAPERADAAFERAHEDPADEVRRQTHRFQTLRSADARFTPDVPDRAGEPERGTGPRHGPWAARTLPSSAHTLILPKYRTKRPARARCSRSRRTPQITPDARDRTGRRQTLRTPQTPRITAPAADRAGGPGSRQRRQTAPDPPVPGHAGRSSSCRTIRTHDAARATTLYSVSRSTGSRPAATISRAISLVVIDSGVRAPAMW
jgi:hypothetical protein